MLNKAILVDMEPAKHAGATAQTIARHCEGDPGFGSLTWEELNFGLAPILNVPEPPKVIIVSGVPVDPRTAYFPPEVAARIKLLATSEMVVVEAKGEVPKEAPSPLFIFVPEAESTVMSVSIRHLQVIMEVCRYV